MTIRIVHYSFEGAIRIEADSDDEARRKFEQQSAIDLAYYAADSLKVTEIAEEDGQLLPDPEPEGLARLSADEVRI